MAKGDLKMTNFSDTTLSALVILAILFGACQKEKSTGSLKVYPNPVSNGANALKLENEVIQEQHQETSNSSETNEEVIHDKNFETVNVVEDSSVNEMEKSFAQEAMETSHKQMPEENIEEDVSNDLKEFGVESDAPDLFSKETENSRPEELLSTNDEEEDDLEIPAFLRRQKN